MLFEHIKSLVSHPFRMCLWTATLLAVTSLPTLAQEPEYTVITIEPPPGAFSIVPWGINDEGDLVGWVQFSGEPVHAFLWTEQEGLTVLPTPPGESGYDAREVSNTGIIAGGYEFGTAWTFQDGQYNILGAPPGSATTEAWAVNDGGDAVGTADPSSILDFHAFYYDASSDEIFDLAPWPSRGYDVNNSGTATGYVDLTAFRWTAESGIDLLGPLSTTYSLTFGFAINELDEVVGEAADPMSDENSRAFMFRDETGMQMIPPVGLVNRALGVNDLGVVVGETTHTGSGDKGWIWTAQTGTRVLTNLIDPDENIAIISAVDINNNGQILSLAFDNNIPDFVTARLDPVQEEVLGDLDGDGVVGVDDLLMLLSSWGACPDCPADLNGDGAVTVEDLLLLLANWS